MLQAMGGNAHVRAQLGREYDEVMKSNDIRLQTIYHFMSVGYRHPVRPRRRPSRFAAMLARKTPLANAKISLENIITELGCGPKWLKAG